MIIIIIIIIVAIAIAIAIIIITTTTIIIIIIITYMSYVICIANISNIIDKIFCITEFPTPSPSTSFTSPTSSTQV